MFPLSLISLPFFLLPWLSLAEDPIHIELQRRNNLHGRGFDYAKEAERVRQRYGYNATPASRKRATGSIPVANQNSDSSYLATISIGTPPQPFSVVLDTGSTDLWVATTSCTSCTSQTAVFKTANSSSFKASTARVSISYGSGQVSGTVVEDTVSMGGFTIGGQTLLGVTQLSDSLIDGSVSGIMGLAWRPLTSINANPFWINLVNNNALTTTDMSFWLKRETGNTASSLTEGGVFTLGGINDTLHTGDIEFIPIPSQPPSFWLLGLSSLTANGRSIILKKGDSLSAIDTGTTLIGGPSDDVANFWAAIPNSAPSSTDGFYSFPCLTKVSATMAFGGKSWSIDPVDMNLGQESRSSPSRCIGAIFDLSLGSNIPSGGANPSWVVGGTFLKNVYSVFRASPPSIGFAQLSSAAGGGSGAGIVSSSVTFTKTRSGSPSTNTEPGSQASSSPMSVAPVIGIMVALALGLFNIL